MTKSKPYSNPALNRAVRRAQKVLAERRLANTTADESTAPGYLAARIASWREAQAPSQLIVVETKRRAA